MVARRSSRSGWGTSARAAGADCPRIVFLVWRDTAHPEGGGSELFVERMAEFLAADGCDVTICAAAYPGAAADEYRNGVRIRRLLLFPLPRTKARRTSRPRPS